MIGTCGPTSLAYAQSPGAGEMDQWLKAVIVLAEDLGWLYHLHGCLKPSVTPGLADPAHTHGTYTYTQVYTCTHKYENNKCNSNKETLSLVGRR